MEEHEETLFLFLFLFDYVMRWLKNTHNNVSSPDEGLGDKYVYGRSYWRESSPYVDGYIMKNGERICVHEFQWEGMVEVAGVGPDKISAPRSRTILREKRWMLVIAWQLGNVNEVDLLLILFIKPYYQAAWLNVRNW